MNLDVMSEISKRLEIIKAKLLKLKTKDKYLEVFGAAPQSYGYGHQYRMNPAISEEQLSFNEKKYNVQLPEEYREFLKNVENGGAGPGYGFYPLDYALPPQNILDQNPKLLTTPFPYDGFDALSIWEKIQKGDKNCWDKNHLLTGYVIIAFWGCGEYDILIISGDQKGKVWKSSDRGTCFSNMKKLGNSFEVVSFLDWYEIWLDYNLSQGVLPDDPAEHFEKPAEIKSISYKNRQLTDLPVAALNCTNLESLNLDNNLFVSLPDKIEIFSKLNNLSVCWNKLESLPKNMGKLQKLRQIILKSNAIKQLPKEIGNLTELTYLYLGFNQLSELPSEIGDLKNLTHLYLEYNKLKTLPIQIGHLTNIVELDLSGNPIEDLPEELAKLKIKTLSLRGSKFKKLPSVVAKMNGLTSLNLHENYELDLEDSFEQLSKMKDLKSLCISGASVPPNLEKLSIESLTIFGGNKKVALPSEISQSRLKHFRAEYCEIDMAVICTLTGLVTLALNTGLESVPEEIGNLSELEILDLSNNKIKRFPDSIVKLTKLKQLIVSPMEKTEIERLRVLLPNIEIV